MPNSRYRIANPLPKGLTPDAMPGDFGCVTAEVEACRSAAALFDYSFLLRFCVQGPDALPRVARLCGRELSDMTLGSIRYGLTADAEGWLLSDLTVWRTGPQQLEIMSGCTADGGLIADAFEGSGAAVVDRTAETAVFAIQGPETEKVMDRVTEGVEVRSLGRFRYCDTVVAGVPSCVGRLGFTGLEGVEILCPAEQAQKLWDGLAEVAQPAGFAAADEVRLKAGLPLFTQEFGPQVTAREAGLGRFRPAGQGRLENMTPRVTRVSFEATVVLPESPAAPAAAQPWPPGPGEIVVTSLRQLNGGSAALGMGYVPFGEVSNSPHEPAGRFSAIKIKKIFS